MPGKEIKELRRAGKLQEALDMAESELLAAPNDLWAKRNISWVFYEYIKQNTSAEQFDVFISWLDKIRNLDLPAGESLLFDKLSWQIGKMAFALGNADPPDVENSLRLFDIIASFPLVKPSEGYTFLFKALHRLLKESNRYVEFADWWNFSNFLPEDYQTEQLPDGRQLMAIAEQAYISYAKHLLPTQDQYGDTVFDKEKAAAFLPLLDDVVEKYPQFQYPAYYLAKLLLALGETDDMLAPLIPFARRKRNEFWVWEILAEAFPNDPEKEFACYCKGLSCPSPPEMVVNLRQKMAEILIAKHLWNEAKTEIELLVDARTEHGFRIPDQVIAWQSQPWYSSALSKKSNMELYKDYLPLAESILFSDIPEETVIVEFVNHPKKILSFIASESKFGFFKYERFLKEVRIADTLKVRFQSGTINGLYQVYTIRRVDDPGFMSKFIKEVEGNVHIKQGNSFGFVDDVFIHPSLVKKLNLSNGLALKGKAIKSFNPAKKLWGWKLI